MAPIDAPASGDFIRDIIEDDLKTNKNRRPGRHALSPEPNGYLHIGHAKSVCLNFGIAAQYNGTCNLRLDDTDPSGESLEYVQSIITDIHWLGFDWADRLYYASDYFERLYGFAARPHPGGQGLCLQPERRCNKGVPGHPYRAGKGKPFSQSFHRRES